MLFLSYLAENKLVTVMILSFRTDRSEQTVQTQIRLLLEEQSDQGLHCLPFHLHLLVTLFYGISFLFEFRGITSNFSGVQKFRNFMVCTSDLRSS